MGKFDCFKDMHHFHEKSQIAEHFYGKSVFLTGTSGLLGQLYLEKLLRLVITNSKGFCGEGTLAKFIDLKQVQV